MKKIAVVDSHHPHYTLVCDFANQVYEDTLGAGTRQPPHTFIVAIEGSTVYGCIGINTQVTSNLFLNDPRFQRAIQAYPEGTTVGEQNILAVKGFTKGIPILINAAAEYARRQHIQKIAFAGIRMSCRLVTQLGFEVTVLGPTEASVFSAVERTKYAYWLQHYQPLSCILATNRTAEQHQSGNQRFAHRAHFDPQLQSILQSG
jgi:hypothetical protein